MWRSRCWDLVFKGKIMVDSNNVQAAEAIMMSFEGAHRTLACSTPEVS